MGVLLFPRPSRSSDRVGISRSIRIHFAVVKHCPHIELDSLQWISAPVTPSDHKKRIMPRCSSFVHTESGTAILIVSQRKDKLCDDTETLVLSVSMRAQKAVPPTHKKL